MAVYYKFKSAKDYDSVSIDGHFISVGNLKEKIVEKKIVGRGLDFDLLISNAQTNEEYADEAQLIPKNTSVLVRRVPTRRQKPIVAEVRDEKAKEESLRPPSPVKPAMEMPVMSQQKQPEESEWADEFGVDLYAMPEPHTFKQPIHQQPPQLQLQQQHHHQLSTDKSEEDNKIKAFIDASASDWQRQTQDSYLTGRGFGRGSQGRGAGGRGFGRGIGMEKKNPPPGYVCHRCGVSGHFIQHCPTNGDPTYDMKKMRPPTGIPKSMLVNNPDGSYTLPSGAVAILRPNEAVFEREIEGLPSNRTLVDIPPELRCPLCNGVLKDAVLTSKCCLRSYCDKCIRDQIQSHGKCVCGAMNVLADYLLPNKTLRDAISSLLEPSTTSSAEHGGSMQQPPDMESSQMKTKAHSGSASQKNISITLRPPQDAANIKDSANNIVMPLQQTQQSVSGSLGCKEHTGESNSRQELGSPITHVEDEVQQQNFPDPSKKKKLKMKRQKPLNGEKEVFRRAAGGYDPAMDGSMMHYHGNPAMYGGYWGGHPYVLDGFGHPVGNPQFPFFGYGVPGHIPCEMPYGAGMMLPDHIGHPSFMPPVPSFQRDGNDAANPGSSIMSREQFEARKAELRRKREFEQRTQNREEPKDTGNGGPGSSMVKKGLDNGNIASPAHDLNGHVEKSRNNIMTSNSLSPQGLKRGRHDRREETSFVNSRSEQANEIQEGFDSDEKSEKKTKASVFSRISFPETTKEKPKRSTEKNMEVKEEVEGNGIGVRSRRMPGHGSERHSDMSLQDSKVGGGVRKLNQKEDRSRLSNCTTTKNMAVDDADYNDDIDVYEHNYKHKTSHQNSQHDINTRTTKRKKS